MIPHDCVNFEKYRKLLTDAAQAMVLETLGALLLLRQSITNLTNRSPVIEYTELDLT